MQTSKIAKAPANVAAGPIEQRPTLARRHQRRSLLRPAPAQRRTIGNQAMLRLLAQQASSPARGRSDDDHEHMASPEALAVTAPGLALRPSQLGSVLRRATSSGGMTLPDTVRVPMERAFSADFSSVRVHVGPSADEAATRLSAYALTAGNDIVFKAGAYRPGVPDGDRLLAHELAHVVQQNHGRSRVRAAYALRADEPTVSGPDDTEECAADAAARQIVDGGRPPGRLSRTGDRPKIHRKILLRGLDRQAFVHAWREFTLAQRASFVRRRFAAANRRLAGAIVADMADAHDEFRFEDEDELHTEVFKRLRTSQIMRESQRDLGAHGMAFGYPVRNSDVTWSKTCGPRVNKAAERYWGPMEITARQRYQFSLSALGKQHPYDALRALFTPQREKCDRTLIHCDYLASVVHYLAFAETIGVAEFTKRFKNKKIPLTLKWNGFDDIETGAFHSVEQESLQEVRPSSERDLVIGDHVIFWNHRAYDLINSKVHESWRLENAILVDRKSHADIFLGHGSGELQESGMLHKLVGKYNDVVRKAEDIITKTRSRDPTTSAAAHKQMNDMFPKVNPVGDEWHIQGKAHSKDFDEKIDRITERDPDLVGLKDPDDPSRMNLVKRPKESA
jgi:Domain of unknown function (DUF4157)/Protein-glutamine gamma-glutamyltransferase